MDESEEHSNGGGHPHPHHGYEWKFPAALSANTTSVHVTALDGVVNVNSLFTVAVFVGLSLATPGQLRSLAGDPRCDAGPGVARSLLVLEVVAFSSFLFSSLVAQGLKLALNLINSKDPHDAARAHIDARVLRLGMLASAVGSVVGCVFLMTSMVMVVQVRLGTLSCPTDRAAAKAAAGLVGLVTTALAFYEEFEEYAGKAKALPDNTTNENKQATVGDVNTGKSKEEAMSDYITKVKQLKEEAATS